MEEDDLITEPLGQEIHLFFKNVLGIDSLKNSVITSAQLLIKNAEQERDRKAAEDRRIQEEREKREEQLMMERDGRMQRGLALVALFAVVSALTDTFDFIIKFTPGYERVVSSLTLLFCCKILYFREV